jgi:membrane associated rhomboid family serine protease
VEAQGCNNFNLHARLFTSAFFHAGLLHIGFNMLAFVPVATSLERQLGSLQTLHLLLMLILLGDIFYIIVSYLSAFVCAPTSQITLMLLEITSQHA